VIYAQFQSPTLSRWQTRLARVPRWAWYAFFIGAVVPIVVLIVLALAAAIVTGLVVMAAVLIVGAGIGLVYRLLHRHQAHRGEIVVRAVRIVDP
jgi:VIT1/CCC1 family predicted Fe2+/Mn2+ transporter